MNRIIAIALLLGALAAAQLRAQTQRIDFETYPDGSSPMDGELLTGQFAVWGVTFELIDGGEGLGPRIARVGPDRTAFIGHNGGADRPHPSQEENVGQFFLTDDGEFNNGGLAYALRVNYLEDFPPVYRAYGELLDLDDEEWWILRALRSDGSVIQEQRYDVFSDGAGNGQAAPWYFDLAEPIRAIEFIPHQDDNDNFGLAFDNFSPSSIPFYPVCDISAPATAQTGESLLFVGSGSYDEDGVVTIWAWDFGEGSSAQGETVEHAFDSAGVHQVSLTVTDDDGNATTCVVEIEVIDPSEDPDDPESEPDPEPFGVAPNPFVRERGHHVVRFRDDRLAGATIQIYDVTGARLSRIELAGDQSGFDWNVTDDAGNGLASGIYFYVIEPVEGKKTIGKLAVIR